MNFSKEDLLSISIGIIIVGIAELVFHRSKNFAWPKNIVNKLYFAEIYKISIFTAGLVLGFKLLKNAALTLILTVSCCLFVNFLKNLLKLKV